MNNAERKLLQITASLDASLDTKCYVVDMYHDAWCPCSDGIKPTCDCICDPDIEVREV